jgi:hypothetical protein
MVPKGPVPCLQEPTLVPTLSQLNPVHTLFLQYSFHIINLSLSKSRSTNYSSLLFRFHDKVHTILISPMPRLHYKPWCDHRNINIWWRVLIIKLLNISFSPAHVTSALVGPNIILIIPLKHRHSMRYFRFSRRWLWRWQPSGMPTRRNIPDGCRLHPQSMFSYNEYTFSVR